MKRSRVRGFEIVHSERMAESDNNFDVVVTDGRTGERTVFVIKGTRRQGSSYAIDWSGWSKLFALQKLVNSLPPGLSPRRVVEPVHGLGPAASQLGRR
jgi:hypothetical protein